MIAHGLWWRVARAVLFLVSRGSLVIMAVMILFPEMWPSAPDLANPLRLARVFAKFCIAPGLMEWLMGRLFAGKFTIDDDKLVLERLDARVEIPCSSIRRVAPWIVPLPGSGVSLQLASGRRFHWSLQVDDPPALAEAIARAGAAAEVQRNSQEPAAIYAGSLHMARHWVDHPVFKFLVFAVVPTIPIFRLHQWVAYGGTFGEYYIYGLRAYLLGFAIYWGSAVVHLVLFAAVLRIVLEPIVIISARVVPARTMTVRRVVEATGRALYYGGVIAFLGRLYLQSLGF